MSKNTDFKPVVPLHQALDEKITRMLAKYSADNPPEVRAGHDLYLEIAAKALGMTYADARKKMSNGNTGVLSARANVKNKMFSIMYSGGESL